MKTWKWLAIVVLILLLFVGSGLGYYLARTSGELADTKATLATTQINLTSTQEKLASTQANLTSTQNDLKNAQSTLVSTQSQLKITQDTLTTTSNNLTATQDKLITTQTQLSTTQTNFEDAKKQITDIQKVYPPKYFDSYNTFRNWFDNALTKVDRTLTFWNQAKQIQKLALSDGYIWSLAVNLDKTFNITVIVGDSIYWVYLNGNIIDTGTRP